MGLEVVFRHFSLDSRDATDCVPLLVWLHFVSESADRKSKAKDNTSKNHCSADRSDGNTP